MSRQRITLHIDRISAPEGLRERDLAAAIAARLGVMIYGQGSTLTSQSGAVAVTDGGLAAPGDLTEGVARATAEATMGVLKR